MGLSRFWRQAIEEIDGHFLVSPNSVMVASTDVDRFLDWLEGKRALLGAEGFKFDGKHLVPDANCIVDYSHGDPAKSVEFHKKTIAESSDFQKAHFVEFVFDE